MHFPPHTTSLILGAAAAAVIYVMHRRAVEYQIGYCHGRLDALTDMTEARHTD